MPGVGGSFWTNENKKKSGNSVIDKLPKREQGSRSCDRFDYRAQLGTLAGNSKEKGIPQSLAIIGAIPRPFQHDMLTDVTINGETAFYPRYFDALRWI